jgi:hypothetical protein
MVSLIALIRLPVAAIAATLSIAGVFSASATAGSQPMSVSKLSRYESAQAALARAKSFAAGRAYRNALSELDAGLSHLGKDYAGPKVIDDTGLMLVAAQAEFDKKRWSRAIMLRQRVLESRLTLFKAHHAL